MEYKLKILLMLYYVKSYTTELFFFNFISLITVYIQHYFVLVSGVQHSD